MMHNDGDRDDTLSRHEFWMRIASACFALWALMIPLGVAMVRSTFSEYADVQRQLATNLIDYKLATERRITLLEERQASVMHMNIEQERRLSTLESAPLYREQRR